MKIKRELENGISVEIELTEEEIRTAFYEYQNIDMKNRILNYIEVLLEDGDKPQDVVEKLNCIREDNEKITDIMFDIFDIMDTEGLNMDSDLSEVFENVFSDVLKKDDGE